MRNQHRGKVLRKTLWQKVVAVSSAAMIALSLTSGSASAGTHTANVAAPHATSVGGNDYPWPTASMNSLSPLRFYYRNCTDYAAYEINEQLGGNTTNNIQFSWSNINYKGDGNAEAWANGASGKWPVNTTPAAGAVAWWAASPSNGNLGHVAIVASVSNSGGTIVVDEYNYDGHGTYGSRTLTNGVTDWPNDFIHIADISSGGSSLNYQAFAGNADGVNSGVIGLRNIDNGFMFLKDGPTFNDQTAYQWAAGANYQPFVGDFNGDGIIDIGLRDVDTGMIYIKHGPTFNDQVDYQWAAGANYQIIAGDFNGDGIGDIGLRDSNNGVFYIKHGPSFNDQVDYQWAAGANYQAFAGDFNGDGIADIGLRDVDNGVFYIKHGPSFNDQVDYQWATGANYQVFAGDFNGDGIGDIGLRDIDNGVFFIKHGTGFNDQVDYQWAAG